VTGSERIEAALSPGGTPQLPAVICYEDIFIRDHWGELTDLPWWHADDPDVERQLAWRSEAMAKLGQDWFEVPGCLPRADRMRLATVVRGGDVFLRDAASGAERRLEPPVVGGWSRPVTVGSLEPPRTPRDVERCIPRVAERSPDAIRASGETDLAGRLLAGVGSTLHPIAHVSSPFWCCFGLWGFEDLMTAVADTPGLVRQACDRFLAREIAEVKHAAVRGARSIWIEDCLTDMLDPGSFSRLDAGPVAALVREIHARGLAAIHYFCGDPSGKWDAILSTGADALSLEESKKGFTIDIDEVVERAAGRTYVLGNLDAITLLEHGSDAELEREVGRQVRAGRRNGGRFIVSTGSPVTPGTTLARVRRFLELARSL